MRALPYGDAAREHVVVEDAAIEAACCDAQVIGDVNTAGGQAPARAAQKVPPAVRRAVIARHEHRCAVPGCRHAAFVDVHHTRLRSEGGDHDADFLVPLCGGHHSMAHAGKLVVRGSFSRGFSFEHADGRHYGSFDIDTARAEAFAQALAALRAMGYREREARALIDGARPHVGADAKMPGLLYEILRRAPVDAARGSMVREAGAVYAAAA